MDDMSKQAILDDVATVGGDTARADFKALVEADADVDPEDIEQRIVTQLVPGVIDSDITLIAGPSGAGKTNMATEIVKNLISVTPCAMVGETDEEFAASERAHRGPLKAVYMSPENEYAVRFAGPLKSLGLPEGYIKKYFVPVCEDVRAKLLPQLVIGTPEFSYFMGAYARDAVVIIDPLMRFLPDKADINDNGMMGRVISSLRKYCNELHCTFIILHHTGKTGDVLGASQIETCTRSLFVCGEYGNENGKRTYFLAHKKANLCDTRPTLMYQIPDLNRIDCIGTTDESLDDILNRKNRLRLGKDRAPDADTTPKWRKAMDAITAYYIDNDYNGATKQALIDACLATGCKDRTAEDAIRRLCADGMLTTPGRGIIGGLYEWIGPRDDDNADDDAIPVNDATGEVIDDIPADNMINRRLGSVDELLDDAWEVDNND